MEITLKHYQHFFANYPNILLLLDNQDVIVYSNKKAQEILGLSSEALQGTKIYDLIPNFTSLEKIIKNKKFYFQFPTQSQSSYYDLNRWLVQDTENEKIWAVSFNENKRIGYNIKILTKLKASEFKFKQLYKSSPIGIAYLDLDGYIMELNQKFAEILDSPIMTFYKTNFFDFPPIQKTFLPEIVVRTIEESKIQKRLIKYTSENGKTSFINIYISPVKATENIITGILVNIEDVSAKIQMEQVVEKQMTFLDNVIEHLPMGVEIYDKNGFLQKTNDAMEKLLGVSNKKELVNKFNIAQDKFAQKSQADILFKKTLSTQQIQTREIEINFDLPENNWDIHQGRRIFSETYIPVKNIKNTKNVMLIMEDITERKNYENNLKNSEQFFREMFTNHSAAMLLVDAENQQIINVNKSAQDFYGYPLPLLKTMKISELNTLSDVEVQQKIEEAKDRKQNYFNFKHILANGNIRDVEVHSTPILQNGRNTLFSIIHDITTRKEVENKLLKNEQKYRQLFEESGDAIFIHNMQGNILEVNQQACEMFGYTKEKLLKLKTQQLHPTAVLEQVNQEMLKLKVKKRITSEQPMLHASGKRLFIEIRATILDEEKGLVQRILRDVTDRKNNEIKLQILIKQLEISKKELTKKADELEDNQIYLEDYNKRLERALLEQHELRIHLENTLEKLTETQTQLVQSEKMASLGVLTSGVAHEINNPINFIRGGIDILDERFKLILDILNHYKKIEDCRNVEELTAETEKIFALKQSADFDDILQNLPESLDNIKTGINRTVEIVRNLKSFSRLDEAEVKPIDIHEGLESTLLLLNNVLKYKADVIKEYSQDLSLVECWANQINQVFMNIIHNAAQSIEEYGTITIHTKQKGNSFIQIIIEDTGTGMSAEVQKKVFEPFYTTKAVGEGNGLGMYITYKIIEKHKGSIEIESKVGKGTKFILTLPTTYTNSPLKNQ